MNTIRTSASAAVMRAATPAFGAGSSQTPAARTLLLQASRPLSTSIHLSEAATRRTAPASLFASSLSKLPTHRSARPDSSSRSSPSSSPFHTSALTPYHFDTHHFVRRLQDSGMERPQAEALVESLADVIDESIRNLSEGMVAREEGEKWRYTQKVDFARLKSEIQLLERNDFVLMKTENERLMADVEKLKQRLREEITRTTAGVRLDLNLEK
ncbi:unnamed protein product, partial [Tilletia controversa]